MMNKTGAGLLRSRTGHFLFGACLLAWGTGAFAQEAQAEADAPEAAAAAPESAAPAAQRPSAADRVQALKSADLEALRAAWAQCNETAEALAVQAPQLRMASRKAYEEARLNSDIGKDFRRQMLELDGKLDQALRELPEVKDKLEEIQRVERSLLEELQFRTALAGVIAAREKDEAAAASE